MSRYLTLDHSSGTNECLSIYRKSASTVLGSFPAVPEPAHEEAQLIMGRLVREYLQRRPIGVLTRSEQRDGRRDALYAAITDGEANHERYAEIERT